MVYLFLWAQCTSSNVSLILRPFPSIRIYRDPQSRLLFNDIPSLESNPFLLHLFSRFENKKWLVVAKSGKSIGWWSNLYLSSFNFDIATTRMCTLIFSRWTGIQFLVKCCRFFFKIVAMTFLADKPTLTLFWAVSPGDFTLL